MTDPNAPGAFKVMEAGGEGIVVEFDAAIYSVAAIKKAAYKFTGRCSVHLSETTSGQVRVTLQTAESVQDAGGLAGEFCNEVLDQDLREAIARETDPIRNLLMAQAFSSTSLLDPGFETDDYRDDPANVAAPDERPARKAQKSSEDGEAGEK